MRFYCTLLCSLVVLQLQGQAPANYYNAAQNLSGEPLRIALHGIIDNHQAQTYNELLGHFHQTDKKNNGKVWDMYSDLPGGNPPYEYNFNENCGNYNSEGDCYNREHSWPKSKFNDNMPMYTDLFHLYPTDGFVNGKRSNYPYGVVNNPNWVSENGSKLGQNSYPGNPGSLAFEPIDDYKGDLARTYFYMSTRYYGEDGGWDNWEMASGADLKNWAVNMLLDWHHNDPVSEKEIARNNAIYSIQQNRNPFIDHPEYADCIWGNSTECGPTTIQEQVSSYQLNLYPNPAQQELNLSWDKEDLAPIIFLFSIQGKQIQKLSIASGQKTKRISLSEMAPGWYWIKIISSYGTKIQPFVVE